MDSDNKSNSGESDNKDTSQLFDLKSLRLSQDFTSQIGVKKLITTVPVHKPNRQDFVRVRAGAAWQLPTAVIELKEDRETYLVHPGILDELAGEVVAKIIFTAINRQGVIFLWPVKIPTQDARGDSWSRSALEAANLATEKWIRIQANMSLGAYDTFEATTDSEPVWPDTSFQRLMDIAFKDRYITSLDHPVVKRLRGDL